MAFDVAPPTWPGVAVAVVLVVGAWCGGSVRARRRWIGPSGVACVAAGAVCGRVLVGTVAPPPPGVSEAARLGQATTFVVLAMLLAATVLRMHASRLNGPSALT